MERDYSIRNSLMFALVMQHEDICKGFIERLFEGRKVKGTIHWVSARHAVDATVRLYENLIDEEKGVYNEDGSLNLNPNSLTVLTGCKLEPNFDGVKPYDSFQFVRQGFFNVDARDSKEDALVFNRIVSLKSSFKLPANN